MAAPSLKKYNLLIYSCEAFFFCCMFLLVTWGSAVTERNIAGYVHTKARVERIWTECRKSCYRVGEITFQREQNGQTIACSAVVQLGSHSAWDPLDIALEPNSCYSPTVLGSPPISFIPLMIIFGAGAIISFALIFIGYRIAFNHKTVAS